ncbi:MAG: phosphoribosylanthranilate isomerase, partial [Desulfobacteraceae bacterium]
MTADNTPQIKICGLTRADQAHACSLLGADAIGCVFYPKSPRNVSLDQAKEIIHALPPHVKGTGVFVDVSYDEVMRAVDYCGLAAVQLHGRESADLVRKLIRQDLLVIKTLFVTREPFLHQAADYPVSAYLVECGKGSLPGGNAMAWNWKDTLEFARLNPLILAGGLSPENISTALSAAMPAAVDVSSGVEASPGIKDLAKVESFIKTVKQS